MIIEIQDFNESWFNIQYSMFILSGLLVFKYALYYN